MIDLKAFLAHNVEDYVFNDLARMKQAGVGYPVIMAAFAGIELLGSLVSDQPFSPWIGGKYFENYWTTYLYPAMPNGQQAAQCVYKLVRNGIAHAYLLKGAIGIASGQPNVHLHITNGQLYIDAALLADHLVSSYKQHVLPLSTSQTGTVNASTMTARANEIESEYLRQATLLSLGNVFPATTYVLTAQTSSSGLLLVQQLGPSGPSGLISAPVSHSNAPPSQPASGSSAPLGSGQT